MKKCIVIPDSFKGTMTSVEVCEIMTDVILRRYPECEIITIPIADGGEGTVDCFLKARAGEKVNITVRDAYGGEILGIAGISGCGQKELLESIAGLQIVKEGSEIAYYEPVSNDKKSLIGKSPKQIRNYGISLSFVLNPIE
jgi:glycerate kinase